MYFLCRLVSSIPLCQTNGLLIANPFTAGNVVCSWWRGEDGQLGPGDVEDRFFPAQLSSLDVQQIVSVTCGAEQTIAYSESRKEVFSWGWYICSLFFKLIF